MQQQLNTSKFRSASFCKTGLAELIVRVANHTALHGYAHLLECGQLFSI